MALSSNQLLHPSLIRDLLIEPNSQYHAGFAYYKIFGLPGVVDDASMIAAGRSVQAAGNPGLLAGKILIRNERDVFGASSDAAMIAKPIGAPRDRVERHPMSEIEFSCRQFDGRTEEDIPFLDNGVQAREVLETQYMEVAAQSVHNKMEVFCRDFFQAQAADAAQKKGGWTEIDWQNGLSGSSLNASTSTLETLQKAINQMRLQAKQKINAIYIPQGIMEKLMTDDQVLGRQVVANTGVAGSGQSVASPEHVVAVLKEHMGFEDVVVAAGCYDNANSGQASNSAYIWDGTKMWIGVSGDTQMSFAGGQPRVIRNAGSFCGVYTKVMETASGPIEPNMPQKMEFIAESFFDAVALNPTKGAILHNCV